MKQGAFRHAFEYRAHDLYETPAVATETLLRVEDLPRRLWEPAAGRGAIARVLRRAGHSVAAHDLIPYDDADPYIRPARDFLAATRPPRGVGCIVTNPPYKIADDFVRHGLSLGCQVIVLLRLMAIEGAGRSDLVDRHLRRVWAGIERLPMMHREGWQGNRIGNSGAPFAWFIFDPEPRRRPAIELRRVSWRGE